MPANEPPRELDRETLFNELKEARRPGLRPAVRMGLVPVLAALAYDLADKPNPATSDPIGTTPNEERDEIAIHQIVVMAEAADEHLDVRSRGVVAEVLGLGLAADAEIPELEARRQAAADKMYLALSYFKRKKERPLLKAFADYLIGLAEERGQAVRLEDGDGTNPPEPNPPSPVQPPMPSPGTPHHAKRHRRRPSAVILSLLLLVGLVVFVLASRQPSSASVPKAALARLATESERQLTGDHAPVPGDVSSLLGFGDPTPEGRTVYPYVSHNPKPGTPGYGTPAAPTPTLNALTDVPHGIGDERQFVHVGITETNERPHANTITHRAVYAQDGQDIWLRIYIDNGAAPEPNCNMLTGPTIARHTTVRVATWDSPNGRLHVIRAWVYAENTNPTWITDAAPVLTQSAQTLKLSPSLSSQYSEQPKTYLSHPPLTSQAIVEPAGMLLGGNGLLGSCWHNRFSLLLMLRQI